MALVKLIKPVVQVRNLVTVGILGEDAPREGYYNLGTGDNFLSLVDDATAYRVNGQMGDDRIMIQGASELADDIVYAGSGNDSAWGAGGEDTMYGGSGADMLWGETGEDLLYGGTGDDRLEGGDAHDQLYGGADRDTLLGGLGSDFIDGGIGDDELFGSEFFNNRMVQEAGQEGGHDTLVGGDGNDTLVGGSGGDLMTGGAGADEFVFTDWIDVGTYTLDVITDFSHAAGDRIDLSQIDADTSPTRPLNDHFNLTQGSSTVAGSLWLGAIDANGDQSVTFTILGGGINHTFNVHVSDGVSLQASDFYM